MPALAFVIQLVIPLPDGLAASLIIVGATAGAPFLPKLVQVAKGNAAFSVGLMSLLMVVGAEMGMRVHAAGITSPSSMPQQDHNVRCCALHCH